MWCVRRGNFSNVIPVEKIAMRRWVAGEKRVGEIGAKAVHILYGIYAINALLVHVQQREVVVRQSIGAYDQFFGGHRIKSRFNDMISPIQYCNTQKIYIRLILIIT